MQVIRGVIAGILLFLGRKLILSSQRQWLPLLDFDLLRFFHPNGPGGLTMHLWACWL